MPQTLQSLAEFVSARLIGDGQIEVSRVSSITSAQPGDLVFVQTDKHLADALASNATAVIAGEFAVNEKAAKPLLIAANPRLAFATVSSLLHVGPQHRPAIHSTAVIHSSAKVSSTASVDAYAVIERDVVIGGRSHVSAGCYIGAGVVIGDDCEIYPRVVIYAGTRLGRRVTVHAGAVLGCDGFGYVRDEKHGRYVKFPQIGQLVIGDYVEIGANVTIDRGALDKTVIGPGTKLDNLVHIGHNCTLGANVIMAAQVGLSGSVSVGDDCLFGGQVGVGDHAEIEGGSILGGQAGILPHKKFRGKGEIYWGTPAKPLREYLKELATLTRLTKWRKDHHGGTEDTE
jgi:UDP-3-O-[3-hydroxymyristoyl] glucosamine N-acyltransferase